MLVLASGVGRLRSNKSTLCAIANPPSWVDTKFLTDTIVELEAEIGELNAQLEAYQLIEMIFDLVTQPPLPRRGKMVKTIQNSKLSK